VKEKDTYISEANATQDGLTEKSTNENEIFRISQTLGVTKSDIKNTLKNKRYAIVTGAVFVIAAFVSGNLYFLGNHYASASMLDFEMFRWFL
jgi:hypothetical protein